MQNEEGCPFIRGLIRKNFMRRLSIKFNDQPQYKKLKNFLNFFSVQMHHSLMKKIGQTVEKIILTRSMLLKF